MKNSAAIHIGTSGWNYAHWQGPFYPEEGVPADSLLEFYATRFHTVELNNSFYHLPKSETVRKWRETVPSDFIFSVKASQYITHRKKLKDPQDTVPIFFERIEGFAEKLGPILFQLPPRWHVNIERLTAFIHTLPTDFRYTFEFRDPTWFADDVYHLLHDHGIALCLYDLQGQLTPKEVTADFIYLRLHGPAEHAYTGKYSTQTLAGWAGAFSTWVDQGKEIFCYFDNDAQGFAPQNALELQEMIES